MQRLRHCAVWYWNTTDLEYGVIKDEQGPSSIDPLYSAPSEPAEHLSVRAAIDQRRSARSR